MYQLSFLTLTLMLHKHEIGISCAVWINRCRFKPPLTGLRAVTSSIKTIIRRSIISETEQNMVYLGMINDLYTIYNI